jgi:hypothetical protein
LNNCGANVVSDRREFLKATAGGCIAATFGEPAAANAQIWPVDLTALSLLDASELLRTRKVSSVELTKACLSRIGLLNPVRNAFITVPRRHCRHVRRPSL